MSATPSYAATPRAATVLINTANTAVDGSGTITAIFTAGASGSRIDSITVKGAATTLANNMVRLWIHNGTSAFLWKEVTITAATASATVQTPESVVAAGFDLPTGYSIRASVHVGEAYHVSVVGGDY